MVTIARPHSDLATGVRQWVANLPEIAELLELWPWGVKEEVQVDRWRKDLAPSAELRRWFGHAPRRWEEFRRRYFAELDARPDAWHKLIDECSRRPVPLLYAGRDKQHNNTVAMREYLEGKLRRSAGKKKGRRQ
jgi:uncharacterized protein YeaO (DUF488 family)